MAIRRKSRRDKTGGKSLRKLSSRAMFLEALEPRQLLAGGPFEGLDPNGPYVGLDSVGRQFGWIPPAEPQMGPSAQAPLSQPERYPLANTFALHSLPGASKVIYLDFDGYTTSSTPWNSPPGSSFTTPAYDFDGNPGSFSTAELQQIQDIWDLVAEDYSPFQVDVTTQDPGVAALMNTGGGDTQWGIRVVFGPDQMATGAGGIAYIGSFNWNTDVPCFVFNVGYKGAAEAASHEAGHTLGLFHDGYPLNGYYPGHGSGATGWAPIMGVGYSEELVQWSKGEYPGANNQEDDLNILTTQNGFGYRTDDYGSTIATASPLGITGGATVSTSGIIEQNTDVDVFSFSTGAGAIDLSIDPFYKSPNLDILATLYDSSGKVITTSNPVDQLTASFNFVLPAGTYYLAVQGTGKAAAGSDYGYSNYASLGRYTVTGSIVQSGTVAVGPELFAVRPNDGVLFLQNQTTTLNVAPRELNFLFKGGADLGIYSGMLNPVNSSVNNSTFTDSIRITTAGSDGQFEFASVRSDLNTNGQVVFDFTATDLGVAENGIQLALTESDHGDKSTRVPTVIADLTNRRIQVDLNRHPGSETTAQDLIDALSADAKVRSLIVAKINTAASRSATPGAVQITNYIIAPATAISDFGVGGYQLRFMARNSGTAGNNLSLSVTKSDHGDASGPTISVAGNVISVDLNTNTGHETTAQELVDAINADSTASLLVVADVVATDLTSPAPYAPLSLFGGVDLTPATASTDFGTGTDLLITANTSNYPGAAGSAIRIQATWQDLGAGVLPTVSVNQTTITLVLNNHAGSVSTAAQARDALNTLAGALVSAVLSTQIAPPVTLSGGVNQDISASWTTDFNSALGVQVKFSAVTPGIAGNALQIRVSRRDLGERGLPLVIASATGIDVVLNSRSGSQTTAEQLVTAVNSALVNGIVKTPITADVVSGANTQYAGLATNMPDWPTWFTVARTGDGGSTPATGFSDFGRSTNVFFTAVPIGTLGNGITVTVSKADLGVGGVPAIGVIGTDVTVTLNRHAGSETTAAQFVSVLNSSLAGLLVQARVIPAAESLLVGTAGATYPLMGGTDFNTGNSLVLSGANAAQVISNFGATNPLAIQLKAATAGPTGNGLTVNFTAVDRLIPRPAGLPLVTVTGTTVNVVLNSNATKPTTAQELVTALNAAAGTLLTAALLYGSSTEPLGNLSTGYSPLVLRGGDDAIVEPGFVGLPNDTTGLTANRNEILWRFANTPAAGLYRAEIFNFADTTSSTPHDALASNTTGNLFTPQNQYADRDNLDFNLDLGSQVVSVVPQPISRSVQNVKCSGGVFTLTFQGQTTVPIAAGATAATVQAALEGLALLPSSVIKPGDVIVTSVAAGDWNVAFHGRYNSAVVPLLTSTNAGVPNPAVTVTALSQLDQATNQVLVYFNGNPLAVTSAQDPKYYRLVDTAGTANTADDRILLPTKVSYDADARMSTLIFSGTNIPDGSFRLDVGGSDEFVGIDEVQRLTFGGTIAGGSSFTLTYNGNLTTETINWDATTSNLVSNIQTALDKIFGTGNTVVAAESSAVYTITFGGQLASANLAPLTVTPSLLGTAPTLTVATVANGYGTAVQTLALGGASGSVTLSYQSVAATPLSAPYTGLTDAALQNNLNTIAALQGNVTVLGSVGGPFTLVFNNALARVSTATLVATPTAPATATVTSLATGGFIPDGTIATAVNAGTLFNRSPSTSFTYAGFLGDGSAGTSTNVNDVDLYRFDLPTTASPTTVTITVTPDAGNNTWIRVFNAAGTELGSPGGVGPLSITAPVGNAASYYVGVSSLGNNTYNPNTGLNATGGTTTGSYVIDITVANALSIATNTSSFATATDLGTLGQAGQSLSWVIQSQNTIQVPQYPGADDSPGHRVVQVEQHGAGTGQSLVAQMDSTPVHYYNFPDTYTVQTPTGPLQERNLLTEPMKQLVREIYALWAAYDGLTVAEGGGTKIIYGDPRYLAPTMPPGGVSLGGGAAVVVSSSSGFTDFTYGGGFFDIMFHEIGHSLGLSHNFDIPGIMGGGVLNTVYPGDNDIIHLLRLYPTNSNAVDLYKVQVPETGTLSAEVVAQRPTDSAGVTNPSAGSTLDSVLTLFDANGNVLARNDDYFSLDAFLQLSLTPGTYYVGVTSKGNINYDPAIPDSGSGGNSAGPYHLELNFSQAPASSLVTTTNVALDGEGDGTPGGVFHFWFQSSGQTIFVDKANDKTANVVDGDGALNTASGAKGPYDNIQSALTDAANRIVVPGRGASVLKWMDEFQINDGTDPVVTFELDPDASGLVDANAISVPYTTAGSTPASIATAIKAAIDSAIASGKLKNVTTDSSKAGTNVVQLRGPASLNVNLNTTTTSTGSPGLLTGEKLVRVVGYGGLDGNLATAADNSAYLIGQVNKSGVNVPLADGANVLVPQDTKLMFDAGALLKLVYAEIDAGTSAQNIDRSGGAIQVLGIPGLAVKFHSYRDDSVGGNADPTDLAAAAGDWGGLVFRSDSDLSSQGIYYNWVAQGDFQHAGGKAPVGGVEHVFAPIFIQSTVAQASRPTIMYNSFTKNASAAISADPDSFSDTGGRLGPDVHGNTVTGNAYNGLFVRIQNELGQAPNTLDVTARFHSTDIVYVLADNLQITGNAGGPLNGALSGRLRVDPGVVVKLNNARIETTRGPSSLIAEGLPGYTVVFTSLNDDRYGMGGTFDTKNDGLLPSGSAAAPGNWGGLMFNQMSSASIDQALITFAGGNVPIEGGQDNFNAVEIHQARVRIANSTLENNAAGTASSTRNGRQKNTATTIYVNGAQPILVNNVIQNNAGSAIDINANSLQATLQSDYGPATRFTDAFDQFRDNRGPLIRLNRLDLNATNGLVVRPETLTIDSIWDDTDIVHVLAGEILVDNLHTFGNLRLQSSTSESLVVKLSGATAGFTAGGHPLEILDRVGGTVQVLGTIGHPVIMTDQRDDTVGAGFKPDGTPQTDTDNNGSLVSPAAGSWRGIKFDQFSNDRNLVAVNEMESPLTNGKDVNNAPNAAQVLGTLATDENNADDTRRLGFEAHGFISPDAPSDADVYSFQGVPGTEVWFDVARTSGALYPVVELLDQSGIVLAQAVVVDPSQPIDPQLTTNSGVQYYGLALPAEANPNLAGTTDPTTSSRIYSTNFRDPAMRLVLPPSGTGATTSTYYVRVRSNGGQFLNTNHTLTFTKGITDTITDSANGFIQAGFTQGQQLIVTGTTNNDGVYTILSVTGGSITLDSAGNRLKVTGVESVSTKLVANYSSGQYQLQIRLRQNYEFPGSTVRFADIRYATNAIDLRGMPGHSPLLGESAQTNTQYPAFGITQDLGDLLTTDRAALSVAGTLPVSDNVAVYSFTVDHQFIESIAGFNASGKTVAATFDVDFADGFTRGDLTMVVYKIVAGNPIPVLIGRESNVEDDQTDPNKATFPLDLARGSAGNGDPFIGTQTLAEGDGQMYYVAIMGAQSLPQAFAVHLLPLGGDPTDRNSVAEGINRLIRLEPINSVTRIVEDHIGVQGYSSNGVVVAPETLGPAIDIATATTLSANVVPFTLSDVSLFVNTNSGLYTANPYKGGAVTTLVPGNGYGSSLQDIVMRSDGYLYGYESTAANTSDTAGVLVKLDSGTGVVITSQKDNIQGPQGVPLAVPTPSGENVTYTDMVDALAWRRDGFDSAPAYHLFYSVRDPVAGSTAGGGGYSKLFVADNTGNAWNGNSANNPNGSISTWLNTATAFNQANYPNNLQNGGYVGYIGGAKRATDTKTSANGVTIELLANAPGSAGNGVVLDITHNGGNTPGGSTNPSVSVFGTTITVTIYDNKSATTPFNPQNTVTAQQVVDAVNNNAGASALARAAISALSNGATGATHFVDPAPTSISLTLTAAGGANSTLVGATTGMAFVADKLYGVSDKGEFYQISTVDGSVSNRMVVTGAPVFQGLALGPQNVEAGKYATTLFAIDTNGLLYALDTTLATFGTRLPVFTGGVTSIDTGVTGTTGLAFSPLDFNLWHPTATRGDDVGHGINPAFDNSRTPASVTDAISGGTTTKSIAESQGGASMYFGLDKYSAGAPSYFQYQTAGQYGVLQQTNQQDLSSNPSIVSAAGVGSYNLPAGALGSLETNTFSLAPYAQADKPIVYFTYFLDTENDAGANKAGNPTNPFVDAARVFIWNGTSWDLLATNNSQLSASATNLDAELPVFRSAADTAGLASKTPVSRLRQQVQELFDNNPPVGTPPAADTATNTWRQARIDLSNYAGKSGLKLRFEFTTAGTMNDTTEPQITTAANTNAFGQFSNNAFGVSLNATTNLPSFRGLNNQHEGFYIDDILVGLAERGEMATVAATTSIHNTTTRVSVPANPDPAKYATIETGPFQLEVRRSTEYAGLGMDPTSPDVSIVQTFDTNERIADGFSLDAPIGTGVTAGSTFTVVGTFTQVYEFNTVAAAAAGHIAIPFAGKTANAVATTIATAINSTVDANGVSLGVDALVGTTKLTTPTTSNRVDLVGAKNLFRGGVTLTSLTASFSAASLTEAATFPPAALPEWSTFTVTRGGSTVGALTVNLTTTNGGRLWYLPDPINNPLDIRVFPASVIIPDGQASVTVQYIIAKITTGTSEGTQTVVVTGTAAAPALGFSTAIAAVIAKDS
ncbi:MAG: DVUA0089 family protein, partial [Planctomycetota bacterium]|nr:DVUA0089 family protein [Planctomycetota bacterium]